MTHSQKIAAALKQGKPVADPEFDQIYPQEVAIQSGSHWTPVETAIQAAQLFGEETSLKILDIGSGCGKFCLVGSLTSSHRFTGVENRPHLTSIAREAAAQLGVSTATFITGDAFDLDWQGYDGFYFFNPFYELTEPSIRMDQTLEGKGQAEFIQAVNETQARLSELRKGTRLVTLHGYGGIFPKEYELVRQIPIQADFMHLWVKSK